MKIKSLSFILVITSVMAACSGSKSKSDGSETKPVTETVAEMELSIIANEYYCFDNKPYVLTIKGGTPFADESKPYKIEVEKNDFYGSIELSKLVKSGDTINIDVQPSTNNQNDEGNKMVLIVTDAADIKKTIELYVPYCP